MHFLLIVVGSDGDSFPIISVGAQLSSRGHCVTLIAPSLYHELATENGIGFIPLSDSTACLRSIEQKWLLATRYASLYVERYSVAWNCVVYEIIREHAKEDIIVIAVDRSNLWADLFARARLGVAAVRVQIDLPAVENQTRRPQGLPFSNIQRRIAQRCEITWKRAMAERGIDTGHLGFERLWRSVRRTVPTIALWPAWMLGEGERRCPHAAVGFLPPPKLAPLEQRCVLDDAPGGNIVAFAAGTVGTTGTWARHFFETSAEICRQLQCKGVFLGGDSITDPVWLSDLIIARGFLPLRNVLKKASAIVHHGGIGTAAAAIEHGVPQVVIPRVFAQPYNAEWLRRLGLCLSLEAKSYTPVVGQAALRKVLTDGRFRRAAQDYARRCNPEAALQNLCEFLETQSLVSQLRSSAPRPDLRQSCAPAVVT